MTTAETWAAKSLEERAALWRKMAQTFAEFGDLMRSAGQEDEGRAAAAIAHKMGGVERLTRNKLERESMCCRRRVLRGRCSCAEGLP